YPDGKIPSDFHKVISKHILATYSGNKSASEYFKFLGLDPQFESRKETRIQRNIVNNESFANED
ncbi:MAG: hypothetical protein RR334_03050, partial [Clostridia bacterium]